ncbi:MAG: GtrA family protein [Rikenellaceae bacterium]|nr:GtrA family protein [Rikenellaceae bacterium]
MRIADSIGRFIDFFYIAPLTRIFSPRIFRYAVCGGGNMVLDLVWYFLIYHYVVAERFIDLGFVVVSPHVASLVVVFPITFFTGFWLNRNVVFGVTQFSCRGQLFRYALSVCGSILLNYLCIKLFVEVCHIWPTPAKALTTVVSVVYSYLAGRYFAFGEKNR